MMADDFLIISTLGLPEFAADLRASSRRVHEVLYQEVRRAAESTRTDAIHFAPPPSTVPRVTPIAKRKTSGAAGLTGSIVALETRDPLSRIVAARVPYAIFVELGTGRRGAAHALSHKPSDYHYGSKPGMQAQPFLVKALEVNRKTFEENAAKAVMKAAAKR